MERKKHTFGEWMIAVRPWSFPASAMPVLVTLGYIFWQSGSPEYNSPGAFGWWNGLWALINIIIFHAAGNTWSDYFDFRKEVDTDDTFGSKTLTGKMFTPKEILILSISLLAAGIAGGIGLMLRSGLPLLWIGLGGIACTVLYPQLKYNAMGDVVILAAYALLPTLGTSYVATGMIDWNTLWLAVPVGLITVAILHANNTRDIDTDTRARIRTLAMNAGAKASAIIYYLEILLPFVWIACCTVAGILPPWCLLSLAAIFPAVKNVKTMGRLSREGMQAIISLDQSTAQLQLVFSLLMTAGFVIARLV